jgi:hypothetical protein
MRAKGLDSDPINPSIPFRVGHYLHHGKENNVFSLFSNVSCSLVYFSFLIVYCSFLH